MSAARPSAARWPARLFRAGLWPAWIALACSLLLTLVPWRNSLIDHDHRRQLEFEAEVRQLRDDLTRQLDAYTLAMRAAAALFAANERVTREEWRRFVGTLRLEQDYPASQALAFARSVSAAELPALISAVRQDGIRDYALRPPGLRDRYVVNVFTEPYNGLNVKALGYDMWQNPERRATLQRADARDEPAVTPKLTLEIDGDGQPTPAIIMYLAVRRKANDPVYGYVLTPLRIADLMQSVLSQRPRSISISIHDGSAVDPARLLYSNV